MQDLKKTKKQSIYSSFKVAFEGIIKGFREERNMKIHLGALILVILAGYLLRINLIEWCICIGISGCVIGAELINCAIESVVDMVMPQIDPRAKKAKDAAAGAVLAIAIGAAIIGGIIFIPKVIQVFRGLY